MYAGFDPTASSLHVGNLLVIKGLVHFGARGHNMIALVGGATGLVGDPSGRSTERVPLSASDLERNTAAIFSQLSTLIHSGVRNARRHYGLSADDAPSLTCINNAQFYESMGVLDFAADIGRHARVSSMLNRDSVKSRLASPEGLSFAELMYQLIQAYDFYHLYRHRGCRLQLGGSDQWGNITAGIDLIHRRYGDEPSTVRLFYSFLPPPSAHRRSFI